MVIRKILKKLTPEKIKKEIEAIQRVKLPPELQKWVGEYEKVGERPYFSFPWIYRIVQVIVFPATRKKYKEELWVTKTLIFMFNILLDDVADKTRNKELLDKLLDISFGKPLIKSGQLNQKEKQYFKFAVRLWNYINKTIRKYPRYKEFKDLFKYDHQQYINAMKYAYLINTNHNLINSSELWIYLSHGMQVFPIMDVDLMCSKLRTQDLGRIREIAWHFQKMARIGNWVSTWEREIKDGDFTSGIWAYALEKDIVKIGDLKRENESKLINKIRNSQIEETLLKEWEDSHCEIARLSKKFSRKELRKDLKKFLSGIEKLIFFHLISRGYK